jgi:hypothetical protein
VKVSGMECDIDSLSEVSRTRKSEAVTSGSARCNGTSRKVRFIVMDTFASSDIPHFLDSFEEHFWLMEKVTAQVHVLIVRITGGAAMTSGTMHSTPSATSCILNVSIGKRSGERPFFYRVADRKLPLDFVDLTDGTSLESLAEGDSSVPSARVTVRSPISPSFL